MINYFRVVKRIAGPEGVEVLADDLPRHRGIPGGTWEVESLETKRRMLVSARDEVDLCRRVAAGQWASGADYESAC